MSNPGAQLSETDIRRIPRHPPLNGLYPRLRRRSWSVEVGLANSEIEHVLSSGLAALGLIADGDGLGSLEVLDIQRQRIGHAWVQILK
jgi:hypothetical protein